MTDFIDKYPNFELGSNSPLVAILLCTYNGARFLAEQLDSLQAQAHQNWVVIASDDASTDQTLEILQQYQAKWPSGKLTIRSGPQKGFCQNFLSLACDPNIRADYYAFCDQDDVWLPSKLSAALENTCNYEEVNQPYVYCGRTIYINKNLKYVGWSPLFCFPRTFRNALIQSIAGGNTMVFNAKAKELLEYVGVIAHPSHDWWLYQLTTGVGGVVFYDSEPQVLYRQHKHALVGKNNTVLAKIRRVSMVLQGRFRDWSAMNIRALNIVKPLLTHGSRESLELFELMRNAGFKDRLRLLEVAGLYRQTWRGTISLLIAALLGKI